jgi:Holliday junction resolvase RusA-like endonuclease
MYDDKTDVYTFFQCSYYDEVFGHISSFPVPTSQTKNKKKVKLYKENINKLLEEAKNDKWPYKERLTITVLVTGPKTYIQRIDLDNMLKNLLDILKSNVFVDDKQIFSLMVSKKILPQNGFMLGLRVLKEDEFNQCIPPLYSLDPQDKISEQTKMWKAIEK